MTLFLRISCLSGLMFKVKFVYEPNVFTHYDDLCILGIHRPLSFYSPPISKTIQTSLPCIFCPLPSSIFPPCCHLQFLPLQAIESVFAVPLC